MDVYSDTKAALKSLWDDKKERQNIKMIFTKAIGENTSLTVKETQDIMDALDNMLSEENNPDTPVIDRGR